MKLKLSLLLFIICASLWAQQRIHQFTASGSLFVPAGITSINAQAWGGGGSGGAASQPAVLTGRGGAGGGGGAYAAAAITVTPGTTINTVVALQTPGSTGDGAAGGSSTITGFTNVIFAGGGSGGGANLTGNTPTGGAGGIATFGTTKTNGAAGGAGSTAAFALLVSGAGGNAANTAGGGGTGGAGVGSGLGTVNIAGNPGNLYGGGGSGAMNTNNSVSAVYNGGAGAAGHVTLDYTCTTYSLSATTAANTCITLGTTTVTLTSSAANLPVGTYTVTYSRSNPSATGLTASMTVTTAGTGTFTATGFTNVGTSTVTITNLASGDCTYAVTANNTSAVFTISPVSVGGTVGGGTTICSGFASGTLTLTGNTGTVVKWQSSVNPFSTWTDIANTATTYTSGALTQTTQFRAVVQSGTCAAIESAFTTVTVNPLPTITLGTVAPVCTSASAQNTTLAYTLTTNSPTTYSITWNASPTNTFAAVTNAALPASPITIAVPAGTAAGTYTGTITVRNANNCTSSPGVNFSVVVNPLPTISLGTVAPVCTSVSAQNTTLAYTGTTNSPTTYSITWSASPTFAAVTNAALPATPITIAVPAGTAAGTYTGTITVRNANSCTSSPGVNFSVVVNPLPTITLGTVAPVCTSASAQNTTLAYTATTSSPTTYSITWSASPTNTFAAVTNAALPASPITIAVPAGTAAGTYTGTITVRNANSCTSSPGVNFSVVVNPLPTITLGTVAPVCTSASAQNTTLAYTATTSSPTTYSITWNASPTNTFAAVTDAALPASPITIAVPAGTAAGTYTGTITVRNANSCTSSSGVNFSVVVNPLPTITLGAVAPVCTSASAQNTTLAYTATSNSPTTYSITWNASPTNTFAAVTDAALPASPITIAVPAGTAAGTYTGTITVRNANSCTSSPGVSFSVVVNPLPTITLGTVAPVCTSASAQNTTLAYTGTTNSPTTYSITWSASPTNTFAAVTNAALPASPITIAVPAGTAAGTYTGTITVRNANSCTSSSGVNFSVVVNPLPTITLGTVAPVCTSSSAQNALLNYTGTTNSPTTYSIVWNSVPANTFAAVTNASLPASPITIVVPAETPAGTYTGTITVGNANNCSSGTGVNFSIIVNPLPTVTLGTITPVCASVNAQNVTLPYSGATNSPTTYSIVWNSSPANSFVPVTDAALPASPITIAIPAGTLAGTYIGTLRVKNANGCATDPGLNFNVTINPLPSAPVIGTITSPTCLVPTGSIALSGLPLGGTLIRYPGAITEPYSGTTVTIAGLSANIYTFTVNNGTCTSLLSSNAVVPGLVTNTYTTSWSNGTPTLDQNIVFAGDYVSAGGGSGNINACSCTVNSGVNVTIQFLDTLTILKALTNNGGTVSFENNSSLIQNTNAVNTGNISYKRTSSQIRMADYVYWSTPVNPQRLIDVSPLSPLDKFYGFNGTTWVANSPYSNMIVGKGYIIRGPSNYSNSVKTDYTASFVGVPNNGNLSGETVTGGNFYLLGNPYPSALDSNLFLSANTFLDGTLYFWTHNTPVVLSGAYQYNSDDYASYNLTGGVGTGQAAPSGTPANNNSVPTGKIAAGQAFFATANSAGTVSFSNAMRLGGANNTQFFKASDASSERHRLWLNMTNTGGAFKQMLIGYVEGASNEYESSFDGKTFDGNPYLDFYSIGNDRKYVIQGRALPFTETDVVPLGYRSTIAGDFTISIDHADGDLKNHAVFIEDKATNTIQDLQVGNYTFSTSTGTFTDRFVLHFSNNTLGIGEFETSNQDILVAVQNEVITISSNADKISTIYIYDLSGKMIYKETNVSDTVLKIDDLKIKKQVLLVKVILDTNTTKTYKIIF